MGAYLDTKAASRRAASVAMSRCAPPAPIPAPMPVPTPRPVP